MAKRPRAWPRSRAGNALVAMADELANSIAAPSPWMTRKATRETAEGASPQRREPAMNTTRPATYTVLWPRMSPSRPRLKRRPLTAKR